MSEDQHKKIHITRQFKSSIEQVWDAWTKPKYFKTWYAPDMFTIPVCEFDLKPEGNLRIDMKGPDGTTYPSIGTFKIVDKPKKLSFTNSPLDPSGNKLFEVLHTVALGQDGDTTTLDLTSEVLSTGPEAAPYLAGMEQGLNQAIGKLENLIKSL
jgi:uncharacterized protein YndB with AHSA1/START domain